MTQAQLLNFNFFHLKLAEILPYLGNISTAKYNAMLNYFQFCVMDPENEDDVVESSCIDSDNVEIRTRERLGLPPKSKTVPLQPDFPWQDR